jgi:hypothetical protein
VLPFANMSGDPEQEYPRSTPRAPPHRKPDSWAAGHNSGSPGQPATDVLCR